MNLRSAFHNFPKKITSNTVHASYSLRLNLYTEIDSLEDLLLKYTGIEPHAFLHVGFLSNLIEKCNLNESSVVSIGMDLLKDCVLIKNNAITMDCYDIDEKAVEAGNNAAVKLNIEKKLNYKCENVLLKKRLENNKYKLAILSQMDYILDDEDIRKLALVFSKSGVSDIIILTPSAFQLSKNPIKIIEAGFKVLYSIRSLLKNKDNVYRSYSRNISYLIKLFSQFYELTSQTDYKYPSGRIFLIHLQKTVPIEL